MLDLPIAPPVFWTLATALAVAVMTVRAKLLDQAPHLGNGIAISLGLAICIWIPASYLDLGLIALIVLMLFAIPSSEGNGAGGVIIAGLGLAILWPLSSFLPGGLVSLAMGLAALGTLVWSYESYLKMQRLAHSNELDPKKRRKRTVVVTGRATGSRSAVPGKEDVDAVAWFAVWGGPDTPKRDSGELRLDTPAGPVIVVLEGANTEFIDRVEQIHDEEEKTARTYLGDEAQSEDEGRKDLSVQWIEEGDTVTLMGVPSWEPPPVDLASGYRGDDYVPVFRASDRELVIADFGPERLHKRFRWLLGSTLTYGSLIVAITADRLFQLL